MTHDSSHHIDLHFHEVSKKTIFGFWVYLMTDAIMFATLFAAYAVLRSNTAGGPPASALLSLPYALVETLVLLGSSLACGVAMVFLGKGHKMKTIGWYVVTFLLGAIFLAMVAGEFQDLIHSGYGWGRSAFLSSYFTLIGTHALHIAFGLFFMIVFIRELLRQGIVPTTLRRLACLKLFWFFSYFIWIFMFAIIYLIGAA
jgi:cytochrome o ubiquinol oxidase subunit III